MKVFVINDDMKKAYTDMLPVFVREGADMFLGIQDETDPVGIAAIRAEGDTFVLEFIYILDEYRHRGAGTLLLDSVKNMLCMIGANRLETTYTLNDSTAVLHDFLEEMGLGEIEEENKPVMRFTLKDIPERFAGKNTEQVRSLKEGSESDWACYMSEFAQFQEESNENVPDIGRRDLYDPDISFVYMDEAHKIQGSIMFSRMDDELTIEHFACLEKRNTKIVRSMIYAAVSMAKSTLSKEAAISFCAFDPGTLALADTISNGKMEQVGKSVTQIYYF